MAMPIDVIILGKALNDGGLEAKGTISGLGLNTFGFLWACEDIWGPAEDPVTTIWVPVENVDRTVEGCNDI